MELAPERGLVQEQVPGQVQELTLGYMHTPRLLMSELSLGIQVLLLVPRRLVEAVEAAEAGALELIPERAQEQALGVAQVWTQEVPLLLALAKLVLVSLLVSPLAQWAETALL